MTAIPRKIEDIIWSVLVLLPVGMASFSYILFKRDFAKIHLQFSCFKFPIFVGEILLFYCLVLTALYWIRCQPRLKPVHFFIIIYSLWLIFKVAIGYHHWGPLAFRHAALFYYPLFAMIGYVFFNRDVFNKWVIIALFFMIIGEFLGQTPDRFWVFSLGCLAIILIMKIKDKPWAYLMIASLLLAMPYILLIKTARMMFVANTASFLLLIIAAWNMSRIKFYIKVTAATVIFVLLSFGFYKYFILGESGRVFVAPQKVMDDFKKMDAEIQKKEPAFKPKPHPAGLYNAEGEQPTEYVKLRFLEGAAPVEWVSTDNIIFRLLIWRDMLKDWEIKKPLLGVDFGKPFLSISLEVLKWGEPEWGRDGWIEPHNSYFNILYRAGIIGIILVLLMWGALICLIKSAFKQQSWVLILMAAILLNWMVAANFLLILELPYTAIPFWTLEGIAFAYAYKR